MPIPKSNMEKCRSSITSRSCGGESSIRSLALVVAVGLGFWLAVQFDAVGLLARPILPLIPEHKLVYTHPSEGFTVILDTAMTFGFVLASPVILYQVWAFLAPALKKHERRVGLGVLFSGLVLFVSGAALAYFVVVPLALPWLFELRRPVAGAADHGGRLFQLHLCDGADVRRQLRAADRHPCARGARHRHAACS